MDKIIAALLLLISEAGAQTKILSLSQDNLNHGVEQISGSVFFSSEGLKQIEDDKGTFSRQTLVTNQTKRKLTGVLSQDLFSPQAESLSHKDSLELFETRSSLKAGLFSLLVPGAGQFYNGGTGNYIKAAGFFALEAAAIAVNIIWTNKGNNQTTFFQNYADVLTLTTGYSVLRYAKWIQTQS